jgi:hypothetical protein
VADPDPDALADQIRSFDCFSGLVEEMAERFHDDEYRDELLPDIKSEFREEAQEESLSEEEAESVVEDFKNALMGEAPPEPTDKWDALEPESSLLSEDRYDELPSLFYQLLRLVETYRPILRELVHTPLFTDVGLAVRGEGETPRRLVGLGREPARGELETGLSEGQPLTVGTPGVLGNDSDPDGDSLSASLVSGIFDGSLMPDTNGSFEYTPNSGFVSTNDLTCEAIDDSSAADTAAVVIQVGDGPLTRPIPVVEGWNLPSVLSEASDPSLGAVPPLFGSGFFFETGSGCNGIAHGNSVLVGRGLFANFPTGAAQITGQAPSRDRTGLEHHRPAGGLDREKSNHVRPVVHRPVELLRFRLVRQLPERFDPGGVRLLESIGRSALDHRRGRVNSDQARCLTVVR